MAIASTELCRVNSSNVRNEVEVGVGGDDLFYPVVDHGGGMKGISCLNFRIGLQELNGK